MITLTFDLDEQLLKLRSKWERKSYATFILHEEDDLLIVLVKRELWSLNRYFRLDGSWRLSMDVREGSVEECLRTFETVNIMQGLNKVLK